MSNDQLPPWERRALHLAEVRDAAERLGVQLRPSWTYRRVVKAVWDAGLTLPEEILTVDDQRWQRVMHDADACLPENVAGWTLAQVAAYAERHPEVTVFGADLAGFVAEIQTALENHRT